MNPPDDTARVRKEPQRAFLSLLAASLAAAVMLAAFQALRVSPTHPAFAKPGDLDLLLGFPLLLALFVLGLVGTLFLTAPSLVWSIWVLRRRGTRSGYSDIAMGCLTGAAIAGSAAWPRALLGSPWTSGEWLLLEGAFAIFAAYFVAGLHTYRVLGGIADDRTASADHARVRIGVTVIETLAGLFSVFWTGGVLGFLFAMAHMAPGD